MTNDTLDTIVRRIVREELAALRAANPPPIVACDPATDVERFLATLAPGERVGAHDLYLRWLAWAGSGETPLRLTATGFGRLAVKSRKVRREGLARRWYTAGQTGPGCTGAPGCPNPMLKMSDRCAEHQER